MSFFSKIRIFHLLAFAFFAPGCMFIVDDPTLYDITYPIPATSNSAISGTVTFTANFDQSTTIKIELTGTTAGRRYPVRILEGSTISVVRNLLTVGLVDGSTGFFETTNFRLADGTTFTLAELQQMHLQISVYANESLSALAAQSDLFQSELTGRSTRFAIGAPTSAIQGFIYFEERKSGRTKTTLKLDGLTRGVTYHGRIYNGSVERPTSFIAGTLGEFSGTTGKVSVDINDLNLRPIVYEDVLNFNGYVLVFQGQAFTGPVAVTGNIGRNATPVKVDLPVAL